MAVARAKVAHFTDQGLPVTGIVHVGAHEGQEVPWYLHMGHLPLLLIEPLPEPFVRLWRRYSGEPQIFFKNVALGDHDGTLTLHVPRHLHDPAADDEMSTSAFFPNRASGYEWGDRGVVWRDVEVTVRRFDSLIRDRWAPIDLGRYNTLVVDVQGQELNVLEGMGECLDAFDYLNIECSEVPIYEGGAPASEVVSFLAERGFRQDSPIVSHDDIMFIRER